MSTTLQQTPFSDIVEGRKVLLKIQQIARFRVRGVKDARIAQHFGLSVAGMARLVGSTEYKEVEAQVLGAVVSNLDTSLLDDTEKLRLDFKKKLPAVLQAMVDVAVQKNDLRSALDAQREIFDRDPDKTFSKDVVQNIHDPSARPIPRALMNELERECQDIVAQGPQSSKTETNAA